MLGTPVSPSVEDSDNVCSHRSAGGPEYRDVAATHTSTLFAHLAQQAAHSLFVAEPTAATPLLLGLDNNVARSRYALKMVTGIDIPK